MNSKVVLSLFLGGLSQLFKSHMDFVNMGKFHEEQAIHSVWPAIQASTSSPSASLLFSAKLRVSPLSACFNNVKIFNSWLKTAALLNYYYLQKTISARSIAP
jgi:hypothetical protein